MSIKVSCRYYPLLVLLASSAAWSTPICVPSKPLPRAVLYPEYSPYEHMSRAKLQKLDKKGDPNAMNMLGIIYGTGRKVEVDSRRSFEFYRRAAELGLPLAQANLAYMYLHGEGTDKDEALAYSWARKSADAGDMRGQELIGYMLGTGAGVEFNLKEAAFCYLLAARQGSVTAQHSLANVYSQGYGIPPDHGESQLWRQRARTATASGKPWFDETPLTEMPAEWNPPYHPAGELPADSLVRTSNYSFKVQAPTPALKSSSWYRFSGNAEPRDTALWIGLQDYDTYGILVEARGKLADGESIVAAAQRLRPMLKFQAAAGRPDCAVMEGTDPFRTPDMAVFTSHCLRGADREIYEIGVSRKSMAFQAKQQLDEQDLAELVALRKLVYESFRFE